MATVATVRRPFLHLLRVQRGLGSHDRCPEEARGLTSDGVAALRIGKIRMEG